MPPNKTTEQQIRALKQALKELNLKKQEVLRFQAVQWRLQGLARQTIADLLNKSTDTVDKWMAIYQHSGLNGLHTHSPRAPRRDKLTKEQKDSLKHIISTNTPEKEGLSGEFWSLDQLKALVKRKYGIIFKSKTSYVKLFKYCGFSYQKVEFKDSRENKELKDHMKLRLRKRLKKGVLQMYW